MPSKNRMTINFSSKETLRMIQADALKNKISQSRVVEELLRFAYEEKIRNGSYATEEKSYQRNKNNFPKEIFQSDFRNNILKNVNGKAIACNPTLFSVGSSFTLPNTYDLGKKMPPVFRIRTDARHGAIQEIKKVSKFDVKSIVELNYKETKMVPEYCLLFINEMNINYQASPDGQDTISCRVNAAVYAVPVYMNKLNNKNLLRFDFLNITRRKFSDVVLNGWDRSKYSHLLPINTTKKNSLESEDGGYFIGIRHESEHDELESGNLERYAISIEGDEFDIKIRYYFYKAKVTCADSNNNPSKIKK